MMTRMLLVLGVTCAAACGSPPKPHEPLTNTAVPAAPTEAPAKTPTVTFGTPSVTGSGLEPAIVSRYLTRSEDRYRACYEHARAAQPTLAGEVTLTFTIGPPGLVTDATGSGVSPEVSSCAAEVVHGTEFPKPRDHQPLAVTVTLTLAPG